MINNETLNMELLNIFVKVSELKSINKSSAYLALTQPAISKKIKQLEEYYGKELFTRSSKGMELTLVGQRIYFEAKKLLAQVEQLRESVQDKNPNVNELRLGSLDSISSFMYPDFFIRLLGKLRSTVITNKIYELTDPFNKGTLDAIFMDSAFKDELTSIYTEKKLYEESYFLVYSKDNQSVDSSLFSINAMTLQKFKLLMYPKYCPIHQRLIQIYQGLKIVPPEIVEIDYSESTITMVAHSNYVTVLPKSIAVNKVTSDISNLAMKQLDMTFMRRISLFSHDPNVSNLISQLIINN